MQALGRWFGTGVGILPEDRLDAQGLDSRSEEVTGVVRGDSRFEVISRERCVGEAQARRYSRPSDLPDHDSAAWRQASNRRRLA